MSTRCLGEHVGRSFGFSFPAPAIGPMASLATVRRSHKSRAPLNPKTTSTARHDLRRVRIIQHHDRRARQIGAGVGQEVGGWLGHIFCGAARAGAARARSWRCLLCPWSVSCPLGSLGVGAYRVNPLADAVPSSRPLRTARARAALWDAVGRRARSRWGPWTPSLSVIGLVCLWWCEASCICAWPSTRVVGVP